MVLLIMEHSAEARAYGIRIGAQNRRFPDVLKLDNIPTPSDNERRYRLALPDDDPDDEEYPERATAEEIQKFRALGRTARQ